MTARLTGQTPWQLLQSSPLELDFNNAVMWQLYNREQQEELARVELLARMTARETVRLIAPMLGYELKETSAAGESRREAGPAPTVQIVVDGEKRTVPAPPSGWVYDKRGLLVCATPSDGSTRPSLRSIVDPVQAVYVDGQFVGYRMTDDCPHLNTEPIAGGGLKCLDCGSAGY